jgi:hypothetical protein
MPNTSGDWPLALRFLLLEHHITTAQIPTTKPKTIPAMIPPEFFAVHNEVLLLHVPDWQW